MLPLFACRKPLALSCLLALLLLAGCSYNPVPGPAAEPGRVSIPAGDEESAGSVEVTSGPDAGTIQRATPVARQPRRALALPPPPKDEALSLEPARAIMIRLPSAP